ncbi:flagellar MS-ring protein [Massilia sp. Root133]|uniref:Flagellar M-ring protein n=1 Tax=Massilia cellulosiltytica TaxID=2683234 RepID=A0A7X3G0R1_9BURK|nr:flagellar MS-ring protein [Massilia sp. Root133]KQZ53403.1 flagellar MS-ring protein [Massilia sp. Root1485]MVW61575.1 flagellar M-ring protein FliF [Telluria cellulosilytica]
MIATLKSAIGGKRLALPPALTKNLTPMLVLAIGITAAVMLYMWNDQAGYKPVFGAHEKVVASDMMSVLDAEHVPYRIHPDSGQVMVPTGQLGKVRMLLAAKGVTAQLPAGLELMDKNDPLGVSQFVQDVRFRRGLEGELAQSILTLDAIASARVHLAIAKSSSFVASDGDKSSASVVVAVKPGHTLSNEQIAAIVNMVSGSVAGLAPARVSLVDQNGNYLSSRVDLTEGFDGAAQGDAAAKRYQDEARANVAGLLGPVLGADNFKVSVTADVDNDKIEETQEKYGEAPKVTSEAMREEMEKSRMALGVPGTLSNRPPVAANPPADPNAAANGAAADPNAKADDGSARKNATTRQYAYDRAITQIKRSRGRLKKLSVAVVLNNAKAATPKTGWTPAEIANIDKILRGGLGIDATRGDVLTVSALSFPAPVAVEPWYQERDNIVDMVRYGMVALGALLGWLLVLRPLMRMLNQRVAPQPAAAAAAAAPTLATVQAGASNALPGAVHSAGALPAPGATAAAALPGETTAASTGGTLPVQALLEEYDLPPAGSAVDVMVDHLKVLAGKEPERVAEVVKQWVQKKNGGSEQ